jgi:DNA-binding helix-hairpin-helix protein with protein kinase domain
VFADGEMPIEQAIAELRFAYGPGASSHHMSAPPGTLALDAFGASIAALFERAFASPGTASRPTAVEWVDALQVLENELVTCTASADHDYPRATACCWCELESRSPMRLFGRAVRQFSMYFNAEELEKLWDAITAVTPPPEIASVRERFGELIWRKAKSDQGSSRHGCLILCFLFAFGGLRYMGTKMFFALLGIGVVANFFMMFRERSASQIEEDLIRETEKRISRQPFFSELTELEEKRRRLLEIQENPTKLMTELLATREELLRQRYLETCYLSSSGGPSLRAGEQAVLQSWGVQSAADVLRERSRLHHSLSYPKVRELIQWAENCGHDFVFDPGAANDNKVQQAVDQAMRAEMDKLMGDLRLGATALERRREEILMQCEAVEYELSKVDKTS